MVRAAGRFVIGLAVVLVLAACAPRSHRAACPPAQKCLLIGNKAEPGTLDPAQATGGWELRIIGDLMVGLLDNDAGARPVPGIADNWRTSADGLVWTFHLRPAEWSDGAPVTADDFVLGMQRTLDPKLSSEYASLLYVIKNGRAVNTGAAPLSALGVVALDARTLQITLEHPAPYLPQLAKHNAMMPAPRHILAGGKAVWAEPGHYVSDGPFVLLDWKANDHITVVKNPRFYDAAHVCLDRIVYYPTTDYLSAERRVRRGELDMQTGVNQTRVPFLRRPDQIPAYVHVTPYLGVDYLDFNIRKVAALADRRVRQALSMAIDRDFITGKLLHGVWRPADRFVPPGVANYPGAAGPYWAGWSFARRQDEARRLLKAAGYGPDHPLSVRLLVRSISDLNMVNPAIQGDWKAVGVASQVTQNEAAVAGYTASAGDFDIYHTQWLADYDDPMTFLYLMQSSAGTLNHGGYSSPAYDALIAKADAEPDPVVRGQELARAEHILLEDAAVAPIWQTSTENLVNPRVTGWEDNALDLHPSRYLCLAK